MNKNVVIVVVSNTNENDKIETYESVVQILQNAVETINKHLKPNNVNFLNGSGLLNDGCVFIGGLQNNNNNNNNEEDGHQNVVVDVDKQETCKSFEQNDVTKILTNKDDKLNILETVTTEKMEPNRTAINSKDLTGDLCVASSSSVKINQGVKSKVFNIDGKKSETYKIFELNSVTKAKRNELEKLLTHCAAGINENYDFTLERYDVKLFRNDFEKLIFSNTVLTSKQNDVLRNVFEEQILINTITKKPTIDSSTKINYKYYLPPKLHRYAAHFKIEERSKNPLFSEKNLLRDKFRHFFLYNTVLTPEQNDLLRNAVKKQISIKNLKEKQFQNVTNVSFKGINAGCVAIKVNNNKPNLKLTSEFNGPKRIISNIQSFDCKICFNTCEPYDGIILQNCRHSFCLDCIRNFIKSYESIIVECPHVNDHKNIKCKEQINESEILGILSSEEIEIYRERQFKLNVQSVSGFIQCCTINCKGFYINEKDEHFFTCYICKIVNCVACKAAHQGKSCRQYKESIDPNLKLSNAYLQNRKQDGLAMDCPSCGAIVERTEGCEGMQCIICKTDLCWATKGLRWGPDGKGDTSAGCRCNVNGKRCHPTCRNCH